MFDRCATPCAKGKTFFLDSKFPATVLKFFPRFYGSETKETFAFPMNIIHYFQMTNELGTFPNRIYFPFNLDK